ESLFARRSRPTEGDADGEAGTANEALAPVPHTLSASALASDSSGNPDPAAETLKPSGMSGPILQATGVSKRYGGLVANSDIDFTVNHAELRGNIGPNGAGRTTFFKMLTCEIPPTPGRSVFEGPDLTGTARTDVSQLRLTNRYLI